MSAWHDSSMKYRSLVISGCNKISTACQFISAIAVLSMLTLVVTQVIFRYVFNIPLGWTQELSVFSLMLAVMAGMAAAFWNNEHFKVSIFIDLLPKFLRSIVSFISQIITIIFFTVVVFYSYTMAMRGMGQISPTTGIPIGVIQLFLTFGSLLASILLTVKVFLVTSTSKEKDAEK